MTRPGLDWRALFIDARRAGLGGGTFWAMTLAEVWLEIDAHRERMREQSQRDVRRAWLANVMRTHAQSKSGLKPLDQYLRTKRAQTPQEMKAVLYQLSARYGFPIVQLTKES